MEIKNARITHVSLTCSDHNVLTFYLSLEGGGWGSTVTKIGNILEDKWFDLRKFFGEDKDDYVGRWVLDERPPKEHEGKKEVWIVNWLIDVPKDIETIFENRTSMYIAIEKIIQNYFPEPSDAYDNYVASKKCYKDKDFFNCSICLAKRGYI